MQLLDEPGGGGGDGGGLVGRGGGVGRGGDVLAGSVESVRRRHRATKTNILVYAMELCKQKHAEAF